MSLHKPFIVSLAALALAVPAWASPELPEPAQAVVAEARAEGLPAEVLEQLALEGLAKGADGQALAEALRGLAADLREARGALGGEVGPLVLAAAADALDAGASKQALTLALQAASEGQERRSLAALADLLRHDFPEDEALRLIEVASGAPVPEQAFRGLATAAGALADLGLPPAVAVDRIGGVVSQGGVPFDAVPGWVPVDLPPAAGGQRGPR